MMKYDAIILPTGQIVEQLSAFEKLFSFYHEGVKGIIKCCVLFQEKENDLIFEIIRAYEDSAEYKMKELSYPNCQDEFTIEAMVLLIQRLIGQMFTRLFYGQQLLLSQKEFQWLGNDLVISGTLLES